MSDPSVVEQILEQWQASAVALPTSSAQSADWVATLGGYRLFVEEKTKFEDPKAAAERGAAHAAGQVHGQSVSLAHNNRLSGIVKKAASQLASSATAPQYDARIVWLTSVGYDAEAKFHQLMATLYGTTRVFPLEGRRMRTCYFFRNSEFYRQRGTLDGAVAAHLAGHTITMKLCLNPYSANWQSLKASPFATKFPTGLVDPYEEEKDGSAYVADGAIDRSDSAAVLRFLEQKYGQSRLMNMDMNMVSASVAVPRGEF